MNTCRIDSIQSHTNKQICLQNLANSLGLSIGALFEHAEMFIKIKYYAEMKLHWGIFFPFQLAVYFGVLNHFHIIQA